MTMNIEKVSMIICSTSLSFLVLPHYVNCEKMSSSSFDNKLNNSKEKEILLCYELLHKHQEIINVKTDQTRLEIKQNYIQY